jgi:hypothetical protein
MLIGLSLLASITGGIMLFVYGIPRIRPFDPERPTSVDNQDKPVSKGRIGLNLLVAGFMLLFLAIAVYASKPQ